MRMATVKFYDLARRFNAGARSFFQDQGLYEPTETERWNQAKDFPGGAFRPKFNGYDFSDTATAWSDRFREQQASSYPTFSRRVKRPDGGEVFYRWAGGRKDISEGIMVWVLDLNALVDGKVLTHDEIIVTDDLARSTRPTSLEDAQPANLTPDEIRITNDLRNSPWGLELTVSDKGGATILVSQAYMRYHFKLHLTPDAWQPAAEMKEILTSRDPASVRFQRYPAYAARTWLIMESPQANLIQQRAPPSPIELVHYEDPNYAQYWDDLDGLLASAASYPTSFEETMNPNGLHPGEIRCEVDFSSYARINRILWLRLEDLMVLAYKQGLIPADMVRHVCSWENFPSQERLLAEETYRQGHPTLGGLKAVANHQRRILKLLGNLTVLLKIHKNPISARLVHRAFNTHLTELQQVVARIIRLYREHFESKYRQITLSDTEAFLRRLSHFNKTTAQGHDFRWGANKTVVFITFDVEKMFPSMSHPFVVYMLDRLMKRYEDEAPDFAQRMERAKTREFILRVIIFLLENTFARVPTKFVPNREQHPKGPFCFFRSILGTPAGSCASPEIASVCPLLQEIEMHDYLSQQHGINLLCYSRLMDDGFLFFLTDEAKAEHDTAIVISCLESLDDRFIVRRRDGTVIREPNSENCLKITTKITTVNLDSDHSSIRLVPIFEFLDIFIDARITTCWRNNWAKPRRYFEIHFRNYTKPIAASNFVHYESAHSDKDKKNIVCSQRQRLVVNSSNSSVCDLGWRDMRNRFERRGYPPGLLDMAGESLPFHERERILDDRETKRRCSSHAAGAEGAIDPFHLPDRPGSRQFWRKVKGKESVFNASQWDGPASRQGQHIWNRPMLVKHATPTLGQIINQQADRSLRL
jgi:hypothetical protein